MAYVDGFFAAVPAANQESYRKHALQGVPLFQEFGATRQVETWGDDVPDGKLTDCRRAVKAEPGEVIAFSWLEYPDKATREAAIAKMMSDARMKELGASAPFDGARMICGGFAVIVDAGASSKPGYVDGSLVAVPTGSAAAYRELAATQAAVMLEHGATRVVEAWGDDVPDGKLTDCRRAVLATADETVVFGRVEWPSKAVRDAAWPKVFADPRMHPTDLPIDNNRRIWGGFVPLLDE